jgi:hypothetical protein
MSIGRKTRKVGGGRKRRAKRGGRVRTRNSLKRSRKQYKVATKKSNCPKKRGRTCNKTPGCKSASGTKRSFCRKKKNTRHRKKK